MRPSLCEHHIGASLSSGLSSLGLDVAYGLFPDAGEWLVICYYSDWFSKSIAMQSFESKDYT